MKSKILSLVSSVFFLFILTCAHSQDYDLIVTSKGDSIACRIDSISRTHIYFEMKSKNYWAQTHIALSDVREYKRDAIQKKQFVFRSGTSIIESPLQLGPASMRDIGKNSLYVGILSVNYSRLFPGDQIGVTVSGGLSFVGALDGGNLGFMVETTLLKGGTKHFFEPGILVLFGADVVWPMIRTGYRYQGPEGFLFRVGPLFGFLDGISLLPAISIGYSF